MLEHRQQGWVLLMVLLMLVMVALPLSLLQQEWLYRGQQQGASIEHLQAQLDAQSLTQKAAQLVGADNGL